jgi:hypothetical protein
MMAGQETADGDVACGPKRAPVADGSSCSILFPGPFF